MRDAARFEIGRPPPEPPTVFGEACSCVPAFCRSLPPLIVVGVVNGRRHNP